MNKVLIIGAGGVSSVTTQKMAMQKKIFNDIILASRTIEKCKKIQKEIKNKFNENITIDEVDADYKDPVCKLIRKYKPDIVLNLALPYQDLTIMEACIEENVHYLYKANYESKEEAKFEYKLHLI